MAKVINKTKLGLPRELHKVMLLRLISKKKSVYRLILSFNFTICHMKATCLMAYHITLLIAVNYRLIAP